jgi:ABC-2 type transport system ATP-binding protein
MPSAIIAQDVYKSFGQVKAVNGISLQAEQGKILGLLGPNGAGKTTLVRMMTTLLMPDSGLVQVAGHDVVKQPERVRELIGLAGQYPAVDEMLTGRENLIMVGQLYHFSYKDSKARANELLDRFSLSDAADRPVKTFSGGMRRRLDLAASIVARPQILFLDEPTTGLDPRTRVELWAVIRELVSDGATLLLTTQYLEEADQLADYITVVDVGKVIAEGTSDQLKAQLGGEMVELRLKNSAQLSQAQSVLAPVGSGAAQVNSEDNSLKLPVQKGTESLLEAVRALDSAQISIADVALRRPSLDEVFLTLTDRKN